MKRLNALFELVGKTLSLEEYETIKDNISNDNYRVTARQLGWGKNERTAFEVTPLWGSKEVREWLNQVLFARIDYCKLIEDDEKPIILFLPSDRTEEKEREFIDSLSKIDYDPGYGLQELYGVVVFKNGTWLSRWEYDGSEGWELNIIPQEKDYSNVKVDENE